MPIDANSFFKQGRVTVVGNQATQPVQDTGPHGLQKYVQNVGNDLRGRVNDIKQAVTAPHAANRLSLDEVGRTIQAGVRTAGAVAGGVGDVINNIPPVQAAGKAVLGAADAATGHKVTPAIAQATAKYQGWAQQHPDAAKNLESVLNIGNVLAMATGGGEAASAAKTGAATAALKGADAVATAGRGVKGVGEAVYGSAFTPTVQEAEKILAYEARHPFLKRVQNTVTGKTIDKPVLRSTTALDKGIAGTEKMVGVQAKRAEGPLWKQTIEPALKNSPDVIEKEADLFAPIVRRIQGTADPGKRARLQEAFDSIQEELAHDDVWSLHQGQQLKSEIDQFTPIKQFRGQDVSNEYQLLRHDMADAIRQKTYNALSDKNIKRAYLDYSNLKQLEQVGVKAISESGLKGGFGSFWSSLYDAALTPVKTVGGQVLYRVGNKLEFVGEAGLKKFGDYLRKRGIRS